MDWGPVRRAVSFSRQFLLLPWNETNLASILRFQARFFRSESCSEWGEIFSWMVIAEGRAGERHLASGCPVPSPICLTVTWLLTRAAPGSYAVDLFTKKIWSSRRGPLAGADAALLVLLVHCWCRVMGRRVASWVVRHKKAHCLTDADLTDADKPRQRSGRLKSIYFLVIKHTCVV